MACLGVGSVGRHAGRGPAADLGPADGVASAAFIGAGVFVALMPFLGGLPGAALAALLFGAGSASATSS